MEALLSSRMLLHAQKSEHRDQHDAGKLRRARKRALREPGIVDGEGQRADAEIFHRAKIVQRFHER